MAKFQPRACMEWFSNILAGQELVWESDSYVQDVNSPKMIMKNENKFYLPVFDSQNGSLRKPEANQYQTREQVVPT